MKRSTSAYLLLLATPMSVAFAQPAAGDLNETQLLGRQIFAQSCGICHLQPARNANTYGPPLNKASAAGNDELMRAFIVNGTGRMPAFKYYLKPAEIDAIVAYVKTVPVPAARAADQLLSGTITSQSGQKLEGVTVSAKLESSTITTSVYTNTAGNYFLPPLAAGRYRVWAQALGFETGKAALELAAARRQDFALQEMTDPERRFRQLPGEMMVAALPEATAEDARMKKIFMNNCAGCHSTSYLLQFRFDEAGWSTIIDLMKMVPVTGIYPGPNAKPNQIMERYQKPLAAYLSRARGPGESSMKLAVRPRPTGEAARAVWTLYDIALNPDAGIGTPYVPNDGTDWTLGTTSKMGQLPHDGALGLDGTIYFTVNNPNRAVTIGKVDPRTGAVKFLKADAANGLAATAHGLARDSAGNFWFDINPGRRALGKLETATDKITIYQTPQTMSPVGGAVTIDVDGKGMIWASTPSGAVRFDPVAEKFTEFKSTIPASNPKGSGQTYGAAGDRDGNGWWSQMAMDIVYKGDVASGKAIQIRMPDAKTYRMSAEDRAFYESISDLGFNSPLPWSQGPRRMGTDKNADLLWVGNSWGASFAKINTRTLETEIVPLPDPTMQAYHIAVDSRHNVWGNLWTSDRIVKLDTSTNAWTTFDLPVRGTEIRHIALLERGERISVVMPVYRTSQMGVLTLRSEAEIAALKAKGQ
ncbi:MAG: c-type cytochrome [Betaproteobacteria bacterium]|nr:c-type cytochrome [Betaproteobacteria bacterium]